MAASVICMRFPCVMLFDIYIRRGAYKSRTTRKSERKKDTERSKKDRIKSDGEKREKL